jgi:SOS-response transcriptional repressor LexA
VKKVCYVFDFALDRALKQISDYSCRLNVGESNPEKKVDEFIKFLPVLAYDGSSMRQVNAVDILDMAMSGTSATLLAKRWESALLVNVDNDTLKRLMANEKAMDALMRIEGFRSLNTEIETIINKSEAVKKAMKSGKKLTPKEKRELSQEEKEYKSKRKEIQEKLIKFATRIPVFMYLTDYREMSLVDVITDLEPELFKRVTGLNVKDFELLVSLNVFNEGLMNDAVYKFKRYEDASLTYTGIDKHTGENVGLYNTVLSREDYNAMAGKTEQSASDDSILANVGYSLRYRSYLPLYSLRAACGVLGDGREVAPEGWVKADGIGRLDETMVVVRAEGNSMEPKIHDGDLCVVRKIGAVDYDNRIVLAQRNDKAADPETGGAYLLKKLVKKGGKVLLRSLNGDYRDIEIASGDDIKIVAEFKSVLRA